MLEDGDLDNAQELAYQTAQSHGLDFPEPEALPPLNTGVDYAFEVGCEATMAIRRLKPSSAGVMAVRIVKRRQPIASYGMSEEAARRSGANSTTCAKHDGLEAAMNLAESMAVVERRTPRWARRSAPVHRGSARPVHDQCRT